MSLRTNSEASIVKYGDIREQLIGQRAKMISRLFLTLLLFCGISHATASEVTSYLQEKAQDFVLGQLDVPLDAQVQVQAASIDERLPLSRCDEHLAITLPAKMEIRRNTTVYLKCEEEKPWDLYLPVRVSIQKPYVTVSTPVAKGDILSRHQTHRRGLGCGGPLSGGQPGRRPLARVERPVQGRRTPFSARR